MKEQDEVVKLMQRVADRRPPGPIFHAKLNVQLNDIFSVFARPFPHGVRTRVYACGTCADFVNKYGDLCTVNDDGSVTPLFWPQPGDMANIPPRYVKAVQGIYNLFRGSVPVADEYELEQERHRKLGVGRGRDARFRHLHVVLNGGPLTKGSKDGINTSTSSAMLTRILSDYDRKTILHAQHLIYEKLPHATPHRPVIDFLESVLDAVEPIMDEIKKQNLVTKFSRMAWVGCLSSLRGGVVGQLLSDVAAGNDHSYIERRWLSMADPHVYLRSTADPLVGNFVQAEKIFHNLGYSKQDLVRYFMTVDQVPESAILWKDTIAWEGKTVVYPENPLPSSPSSEAPSDAQHMSFRSFVCRVLPSAQQVDLWLQPKARLAFFTTGSPGAKPPFQFSSTLNTAAWYLWSKDLPVTQARLKEGWNRVSSILSYPHMWDYLSAGEGIDYFDDDAWEAVPAVEPTAETEGVGATEASAKKPKPFWPHSRHGVRYVFALQDAQETQRMSAMLFPAILRAEFHCVRKTIEAFSKEEAIRGPLNALAQQVGGVAGGSHRWTEMLVKVTTVEGFKAVYKLTLFD